ncbi:MAG: fumarylacetoacetate hydrolase family protein [Euryarchaeota archaeon]|nr:fumarylacetoacetate hydrolase family protein [Euryarchaeota archaeon]
MHLVRFTHQGHEKFGLLRQEEVIVLGEGRDLESILHRDMDSWLPDMAHRNLSIPPSIPAGEARLQAPLAHPSKMLFLGLNYADHARETGASLPKEPVLFAKFPNSITGPQGDIQRPPGVAQLDYEAELGVILGRRAHRIPPGRAMDHVLGYTCVNDISARDIQTRDRQWTRGKSADTFCPLGPSIVTRDEIPDPHTLKIQARVNGEVRQDSTTAQMHLKIPEVISTLSQTMTLEPGDLISTGTPAGVGMARRPPAWLRDGDTVEVTIEKIGSLKNRVQGTPEWA